MSWLMQRRTIMKQSHRLAQLLSLFAMLVLTITAVPAAQPGHRHEPGSETQLHLKDGQKWPTDAALRQGMVNIRNTLTPSLPAIHENKLDAKGYDQLADKTNAEVAYIVKNCHLEKDADAMLHLVLTDIIAGVGAMAGKDKQLSRQAGASKVVHALESYGNYFNHPGW
jgi:hypothetical protein